MSVFPLTLKVSLAVRPFNHDGVMPLLQRAQLLDDEAIPVMEYTYTLKSAKHLGLLKLQAHTRSRKFPVKFWYKLAYKFIGASREIFGEKCSEPMVVQARIPQQNHVDNLLYNFRPYEESHKEHYRVVTLIAHALREYTTRMVERLAEEAGYRPTKARVIYNGGNVTHINNKVFTFLAYRFYDDKKFVYLRGEVQKGYQDSLLQSRVLRKLLKEANGYGMEGHLWVNNEVQAVEAKLLFPSLSVDVHAPIELTKYTLEAVK